ncbi:hypothetical protein H9651_04560 [Microbacterium sp. Sa4CUA7]|uniref:Yip1 domain-containing protein n=1 Tax=Microbacterium pullorum TaxID=2762236 RepID=A0ABR8S0B9_9MICO|nr:hypothetical protein [Microbacterium pullorum]MBD7956898.1 hypothetical protein [Microbacterium pullorum]
MSDQQPPAPAPFPTSPQTPHAAPPPYAPHGAMFAAPYRGPVPAPVPTGPPPVRSAALGIVALVLALAATVVGSFVAAIAAVEIGEVSGAAVTAGTSAGGIPWASLAPVRGAVLVGEVTFWLATVLGVWALAQAIVAIVQGRGRGAAIAAVIIAALGPAVFIVTVLTSLIAGAA